MSLPENYDRLPHEEIVELSVAAVEDDGLFWLPMTYTPASLIFSAVKQRLPERRLDLSSPKPDWDHVIIDITRLSDWPRWLVPHATERFRMKERGIPDHKLPPLPKGVRPDEDDED